MGECDANDHFGFSLFDETLTKGGKRLIVFSGDVGDEKEDRSDMGSSASGSPDTLAFAAVISERCKARQFGDGFVGENANFWQLCHEGGHSAIGHAFDRAQSGINGSPDWVSIDEACDLCTQRFALRVEHCNEFENALPCHIDLGCVEALLLGRKITHHLAHTC